MNNKKRSILPSYVGGKSFWVNSGKLDFLDGMTMCEPFSGSSVISMTYANKCLLNDNDKFVYKITSDFDKQIIYNGFGVNDYMRVRGQDDWYRYAYMLQKISFSGVFRYSRNGYNVPPKKDIKPLHNVAESYNNDLLRFNELQPVVTNTDYMETIKYCSDYDVFICDPPYESSKADYNKHEFDYHLYWEWIYNLEGSCKKLIIFDRIENLFDFTLTKKMNVNGKYKTGTEAMKIFSDDIKRGAEGEKLFLQAFEGRVNLIGGAFKHDFESNSGDKLELKTDYYNMDKTPNFFIERYSNESTKRLGGPWQSLGYRCKYYVYMFYKNKKCFVIDNNELCGYIESIESKLEPISIPNQGYNTMGYKVNRDDVIKNCKTYIIDIE